MNRNGAPKRISPCLVRMTAGGLLGFFLLHPASMLIMGLTSPQGHGAWEMVASAASAAHLPMGLLFFALGAAAGYVQHRHLERLLNEAQTRQALELDRERLDVLLQTAGAVCHELGQPLTVIRMHTSLLDEHLQNDRRATEDLNAIVVNVERLTNQMQMLRKVTRYVTKPYVGDVRIIDLERASNDSEDDGRVQIHHERRVAVKMLTTARRPQRFIGLN